MDSRSLFITGTRFFGVWELLRCIDYAVECFDLKANYYRSSLITAGSTYTHIVTYLVVGSFLLGEAPRIAKVFYPSAVPRPDPGSPVPPAA